MALSTDYSTSASRSHSSQLDPKNIDLTYLDPDARAVLDFWFDKNNEAYWFEQNDRLISRYKISLATFGMQQSKANVSLGVSQSPH